MPEATVLYSVAGVVIAALFVWAAVVLKTAKEPWGRAAPMRVLAPDVELEPAIQGDDHGHDLLSFGAPRIDADETAKATPVALGEARASAAPPASDDAKPDVPAAKV